MRSDDAAQSSFSSSQCQNCTNARQRIQNLYASYMHLYTSKFKNNNRDGNQKRKKVLWITTFAMGGQWWSCTLSWTKMSLPAIWDDQGRTLVIVGAHAPNSLATILLYTISYKYMDSCIEKWQDFIIIWKKGLAICFPVSSAWTRACVSKKKSILILIFVWISLKFKSSDNDLIQKFRSFLFHTFLWPRIALSRWLVASIFIRNNPSALCKAWF